MSCPNTVTKSLEGTNATKKIEWDYSRDLVSIWYDAGLINPGRLASEIRKLGYNVELVDPSKMKTPAAERLVKAPVPKDAPAFFLSAFEAANRASRPVVIDFSAPWCAPCVRLKKETLENPDVARLLKDVQVIYVDLDEYPALASAYQVTTIPDVFFIGRDGLIVDRLRAFEAPGPFLSRLKRFTRKKAARLHELSEDAQEMKEAFNGANGKVRLLLLVSPG